MGKPVRVTCPILRQARGPSRSLAMGSSMAICASSDGLQSKHPTLCKKVTNSIALKECAQASCLIPGITFDCAEQCLVVVKLVTFSAVAKITRGLSYLPQGTLVYWRFIIPHPLPYPAGVL